MLKKYYLLSPGPTPIPDEVLAEASKPIIHHRTPEFSAIMDSATEGLRYVFQTEQDVYVITSSGTGAMEAAVVNLLSPGDKVITVNGGKFGARWGHICRTYGAEVNEIAVDWGEGCPREKIADLIFSEPETKAVFTTLTETSTGTLFDIEGYGRLLEKTDIALVVDGISGLGTTPCPMDEWGIDVLISGSQKSFMTPPGLAYIAFSEKAWPLVEASSIPKFYFDAKAAKGSLAKHTTPWTPAISLVRQQKKALDIIRQITLEGLFAHHTILGDATRAGIRALDLELLSKSPGNILTAVLVPPGLDGKTLVKTMQDKYGAYIAGAQEPHKGEFFRLAHLGYMSPFDTITGLSALEMTLADMGHRVLPGSAVSAAEAIFKENWQ
jgi:aspartate aminotransferase-like enzyme